MLAVFCMPPAGATSAVVDNESGCQGPAVINVWLTWGMTGRMLSLMLDRVTHALITDLAETAGVSRSAWCRDVLAAAAMAELDRQEQADKRAAVEVERERLMAVAEGARQAKIERMQRNQHRAI